MLEEINNDRINYYVNRVKRSHFEYECFSQNIKRIREVTLTAVKKSGRNLEYAPKLFWEDKEIVYAALKFFPNFYKDLSEEMKKDPKIINRALKSNGLMLEHVPREIVTKKLIIKAIENNGNALNFFPEYLENKEMILLAIKTKPLIIGKSSFEIRRDIEVAKQAVALDGLTLSYFSLKIQDNEEIVKLAVNNNGDALEFVSNRLKQNREICLIALNNSGDAIENVPVALIEDEEIMIKAISKDKSNVKYLKKENKLYKSHSFAKFIINNSFYVFSYFSEEIKDDKEIALIAMKRDGTNISSVSSRLSKDRDVIIEAIKNSPYAMSYIRRENITMDILEELREDKEFINYLERKQDKENFRELLENIQAINRSVKLRNKLNNENLQNDKPRKKI